MSARESILVVMPDEVLRRRVRSILWATDREVHVASTAREGLDALRTIDPDLVMVAMDLPDVDGASTIGLFRDRAPRSSILAMEETPTPERAVEVVRAGAVDYLGLPPSRKRLIRAVDRSLQEARSSRVLQAVQQEVRDRYGFSRLLSQSPRMLTVFDQIRAVAPTEATVLVRGETGTGKELVARAIHERSRRQPMPCISVNCGAFTESLLESELFGHEKGSFTGAVGRRQGLFEMADGGTLFLDELGETSLNVQVNLLRVLEEMVFRRVGGRDEVRVDVRFIAATNVDLEQAISEGSFRRDLYYRLNVFPIHLPPLRKRREDVPLLMRHFLDEVAQEYELDPPIIAAEALEAILEYRWPGNVRQLRTLCERWVITHASKRLERKDLPAFITGGHANKVEDAGLLHIDEEQTLSENTRLAQDRVERAYLHRLLRKHRGHLGRTAEAADIAPRTLYTKMKKHGLDAGNFKE